MKNQKNLLGLFLAFLLFPISVLGQQFNNEGMVYKVLSEAEQTVILHKAHRCVQNFQVPYAVPDYSESLYRVKEIEYDAFRNLDCLYVLNLNGVEVIRDGYARRYEDGSIDYFGAFANCRNLKEVAFGALKHLGDYAFYGCNQLTELFLDHVEMIGKGAFQNCKNLEKVSLGGKVQMVLEDAFVGAAQVKQVEVKAIQPPVCGENVFSPSVYEQVPLCVPAGSGAAYRRADGWKHFVKIEEMPVTAIQTVTAAKVSLHGGEVWVDAVPRGKMLRVYEVSGRQVLQKNSEGGVLRLALPLGKIYWIQVEHQPSIAIKM